jgi:ABC-type cobalamin/Fe3+-siderophores transport system ATPase subunit
LDLAVTYANRVLLFGDKHIVADGKPEDVLKDTEMLLKYRVRPTSLLKLNLDLFAKTGEFLPAESLTKFVS